MKTKFLGIIAIAASLTVGVYAQSSLPAPGTSTGNFGGPGAGWGNSLMAPGGTTTPYPGGSWGPAFGTLPPSPSYISGPGWSNSGTMTVMAAGYDVYGDLYQIPMNVHYWYNGFSYIATVLSAYNPDSDMWSYGIDMPAISTSYCLRGTWFNFYVPLSFGTFYFNL